MSSSHKFSKWDIVYASRFPESIKCKVCGRHYTVPSNIACPCGVDNNFTSLITKIRPILIWIDQNDWYESMSFGIPLSSSRMVSNKYNYIIQLSDYAFHHTNLRYQVPMRAAIHQSTRWDGNTLFERNHIGTLTNATLREQIDNAMLEWVFPKL